MDYLSYWSLLRKPFALGDGFVFFAGVSQREAIAGLNYFATNQLNSAFLVAPARCGMSQLLRHVKRMRGFGDCAAEVVLTSGRQPGREAVQQELCQALGYQGVVGDCAEQLDRAIEASAQQGLQTIWLIDRCQAPAARVARDLVMAHSSLSVVISTTHEELGKQAVEFGRCAMQIELTPLSLEDTITYVRFCIDHAGGTRQLFPDNAVVRLHELTGGALADLAVVAESALALAASHTVDLVGSAFVEAIDEQIARAA